MIKETEGVLIETGKSGIIDGGGELRLPAELVDIDGNYYSGEVRVKNKYFGPDNPAYIQEGPSNMTGLNEEDNYVLLGSLGMYYVELLDPSTDEKLTIPSGQTASISFPIADVQKDIVPASIPLWSLDEDAGIWILEGEAQRIDDKMVAEVSHFSFWNCDLPYAFVPFCATFITRGLPAAGIKVDFSVNNQGFGSDITDSDGVICGKLPIGAIIDLKFYYDDVELGETTIGEFTISPMNLEIEVPELPEIRGVAVDCSLTPIQKGYGIVTTDISTFAVYIEENGQFQYFMNNKDHNLVLVNQLTNNSP